MTPDSKSCGSCAVRDNALTRRDFVSLATMSAVSLALAACGAGAVNDDPTGPGPTGTGTFTVRPGDHPALATVGGTVKVRNSPPVALARTASGLVAFSLSCTHQGTTTVIDSDYTIFCPNHGAQFTAAGVWTGGERTSNLVRLPVELDSAGTTATITLG
ncbi:MAG: Rieske (2Fe-2S) protein [Gemmatimonadaceae bacterium]|nr:Rieske (2Fe-2S) protein [Gemmatimonadaceae bacterium]